MPATPRTHRYYWLTAAIALVVVAADQLTKWWAESTLVEGEPVPFIGDLIRFQLIYNSGAAFSIGAGATWVFAILALAAAVGIAWYAWRVRSWRWSLAFGLVLGGAVTHLGDRLFRAPGFAQGHVVDFIAYGNLFIGNVADIAIVGGGALAVLFALLRVPMRREPDASAATPSS